MMLAASELSAVAEWRRSSWAVQVVDRLDGCVLLDNESELFLVGVNGDNARGSRLHRRNVDRARAWSSEQIHVNISRVVSMLLNYRWDGGRVIVSGLDAQAVEIDELPAWPERLCSVLPSGDWRKGLPTRKLQVRLTAEHKKSKERL